MNHPVPRGTGEVFRTTNKNSKNGFAKHKMMGYNKSILQVEKSNYEKAVYCNKSDFGKWFFICKYAGRYENQYGDD